MNDDVNRRGSPAFADEGMSTGAKVRIAIAVVAGLALLMFVLSNTESAQVSWLGWDFDAPLWIMLLGAALLGALTMQAVGWFARRRRKN